MNNETKLNIKRIKELNTKDEFSDKDLFEFDHLCIHVFFPMLNEIERLNKKIKTLEQKAKE